LFIPPGVAHGFLAETDLLLGYLVDRYFDGTDESGIAWNDPELGIGWPVADPVVSDRDRSNPSLSEALRDPVPYVLPVG
jgi:dTDP-4-dehydrorhamnose 3,5-epimerase